MTKFKSAEARLDAAAYALRKARATFDRRHSERNLVAFEATEDAYEDALAAFAVERDRAPVRMFVPVAASPQMDLFA